MEEGGASIAAAVRNCFPAHVNQLMIDRAGHRNMLCTAHFLKKGV